MELEKVENAIMNCKVTKSGIEMTYDKRAQTLNEYVLTVSNISKCNVLWVTTNEHVPY